MVELDIVSPSCCLHWCCAWPMLTVSTVFHARDAESTRSSIFWLLGELVTKRETSKWRWGSRVGQYWQHAQSYYRQYMLFFFVLRLKRMKGPFFNHGKNCCLVFLSYLPSMQSGLIEIRTVHWNLNRRRTSAVFSSFDDLRFGSLQSLLEVFRWEPEWNIMCFWNPHVARQIRSIIGALLDSQISGVLMCVDREP